jgi:hypothetical protein
MVREQRQQQQLLLIYREICPPFTPGRNNNNGAFKIIKRGEKMKIAIKQTSTINSEE